MFDIVYLSYDEPNAEQHWRRVQEIAPHAYRVHGVKGFDAAHKEVARHGFESHVCVVDGDAWISRTAFEKILNDCCLSGDMVESWSSINTVNGLSYGNGGLKLWPKELLLTMCTHESANNEKDLTDFCWSYKYKQHNAILAKTCPNGSPYQAWRAGFREGLKMSLNQGHRIKPWDVQQVYSNNYKRLLTWMTVGADVDNGLWAILGARMGFYLFNMGYIDLKSIQSHANTKDIWDRYQVEQYLVEREIDIFGFNISNTLGIQLSTPLTSEQSAVMKQTIVHPSRTDFVDHSLCYVE